MTKISRRKFIGKCVFYNASAMLGAGWLISCAKDSNGATMDSEWEYLPIQNENPAIALWREKCEACGDCVEACAEKQKVFGTYHATAVNHVCIHCGTCIMACEEGALTEKYHWKDVLNAIDDPSTIVIASISPSVRVGIGDYFGMEPGIIFGNTGGVTRAALRTAYYNITGANPPANLLDLQQVQGLNGLKEAQVTIGNTTLNVAVCYEMRNAQRLLEQVMNGTCKYHFIEVMACKGGCVGGAGQPAGSSKIQKRISALNAADIEATTRYCHENPEIAAIYTNFLGEVGGPEAKKYLHTVYNDKSNLLLK
jgi:iron only hydrogenase large subunit-like protein